MNDNFIIDDKITEEDILYIENWLREQIHKHGALYKADTIIQNVCGDSFDPNVYVDYLIDKYSKIYF